MRQEIILPTGTTIEGHLVEHLGQGRVIIEYRGQHYAGEKIEAWQRRQSRMVTT